MVRSKQVRKTKKSRTALKPNGWRLMHWLSDIVTKHPYAFTCISMVLYLLVFQRHFLFSTDVWAETHTEYLSGALHGRYTDVFKLGSAGYLSLLPAFLARLYIRLHAPPGYIDIYYQVVIVATAIGISAFISSRFNETLFRNTVYRVAFAFALLFLLYEKSTFTFINIWYVCFVPLLLICLNPQRLERLPKILYTLSGVLISLTKPSLLLIPFVAYRAYKTKEYLSNGLILGSVLLQASLMLFLDPRQVGNNATHNPMLILKAWTIGGSVEFLKLFRIVPTNGILVVGSGVVLSGLIFLVYKRLGLLRTGLVVFLYAYALYTYLLAPDSAYPGTELYRGLHSALPIYTSNLKIQRELLINVSFVFLIFFGLAQAYQYATRLSFAKAKYFVAISVLCMALILLRLYIPIDVESAGTAANISSFRQAIDNGQSTCMPIPPTPAYTPGAHWLFGYNTTCRSYNIALTPNYGHMDIYLKKPFTFTIPNPTSVPLKTVSVIVRNSVPGHQSSLILEDTQSGIQYRASIPARQSEEISFIPFNISGMPYRSAYEFRLTSEDEDVYWGKFTEQNLPAYYAYFGETSPNFHHGP